MATRVGGPPTQSQAEWSRAFSFVAFDYSGLRMLPLLAHPERVAASSIRGYVFQTVGIALRWLLLSEGELLLCEGDEDADHYIVGEDGVVRDVTEVQFKDMEGTLSVRTEQVQESIFNFLRAYKYHSEQQRRVHFVFTTSAARARQQKSSFSGKSKHTISLALDVLRAWEALGASTERLKEQTLLIKDLRAVVLSAKPPPSEDDKPTKAELDYQDLETSVAYLDVAPDRWGAFLDSVTWQFNVGGIAEQSTKLEGALAADARTCRLPAQVMAERLIVKVFETSSKTEHALRVLDREALNRIAQVSSRELESWAERAKPERIRGWMAAVAQRLDQIEARINQNENAPRLSLLRTSERELRYFSNFGSLRAGNSEVRMQRGVVEPLADAALVHSLVVVGDPGSGKSGVLFAVATELQRRGHDVVTLTAETAQSLGDALLDVLDAWTGEKEAVLLIDALDSMRDDAKASSLRKTISALTQSTGRWRVTASIRTFDLYHGSALARVFAGQPPTAFSDPRFPAVRHVSISELTDEELKQLDISAPQLFAMVSEAPSDFRALLRVPLHLSLAATLLEGGLPTKTLSLVRTRLELLDLYWGHHISEHAASKDARETLLRNVCKLMIAQRSLQVRKAELNDSHLYDLLTTNVLREPPSSGEAHDDTFVAFSHHVLFDYAVARLWVPHDPDALSDQLATDPQLLIVIRPSLELAFQRSWAKDPTRRLFWRLALRVCQDSRIREVGKIIGPGIAAQEAGTWIELQPLADALQSFDEGVSASADAALGYVVGSVVPRPYGGRPIAGTGAGPWAELAEFAASLARIEPRQRARQLLYAITENPRELTAPQMAASGIAARLLFMAANMQASTFGRLLVSAIRFACRTFDSDRAATSACLRTLLQTERLKAEGYAYLPTLAHEIKWLHGDPDLVEAIYIAAFGTREESNETTELGGIILRLASHKRQDYEGALYSLQEAFPSFLRATPKNATRALISVLRAYIEHKHPPSETIEGAFLVNSKEVPVRTDYSEIWDQGPLRHELVMADAWEAHLVELASVSSNQSLVQTLFDISVDYNRFAFTWRRWLKIAAYPAAAAIAGSIILPLLESAYVLWAGDTAFLAGETLKIVFATRSPSERAQIEKAILGAASLDKNAEDADKTYSRLLGCVDERFLVTADAKAKAMEFRARALNTRNESAFSFMRMSASAMPYGTDEWLTKEGVQVEEEANRAIRNASRALAAMRESIVGQISAEGSRRLTSEATKVIESLATESGVHLLVIDEAWGEVAQAISLATTAPSIKDDQALRKHISDVARAVATCPCPRPSVGQDRAFHNGFSWPNPHARGDIVEALTALALAGDDNALASLELLSNDDVASVRYRVLIVLGALAKRAPQVTWRIAERIVIEEPINGVLAGFVRGTLDALRALNVARVSRWLGCLLNRVVEGPGAPKVRELAYQLLTNIYLNEADACASALVLECTSRPESKDADALVHHIRLALAWGPTEPPVATADAQRKRAQALLLYLVREGAQSLAELIASHPAGIPEERMTQARSVASLLEACSKEIYFASGASDAKADNKAIRTDLPIAARFLKELAQALEHLAETGLPQIVHFILQTLEHLLPSNPRAAFHLVARTVVAGKKSGYQYDPLAVELVVGIATRFLAEYRALLQQDAALRDALLDVLDVFVRAGWQEAQHVTYGLQDIFR